MMGLSSSVGHPLQSKMTPEHIDKVLNLAEKQDERQFILIKSSQENELIESKANRIYFFFVFLIIVLLLCFILYLFKEKTEILIPVLTGIGGLGGGFLGGWGARAGKERD